MKPEEIKNFIEQNHDLFETSPNCEDGNRKFVEVDNIAELLTRFLESKEYKAFIERSKWQETKKLFGGTTIVEVPADVSDYRTFNND